MTKENDPFSFPPFPADNKIDQPAKDKPGLPSGDGRVPGASQPANRPVGDAFAGLPSFPNGASGPDPAKPLPGETPLSDDEIREVRKILADFRSGKKVISAASAQTVEEPAPAAGDAKSFDDSSARIYPTKGDPSPAGTRGEPFGDPFALPPPENSPESKVQTGARAQPKPPLPWTSAQGSVSSGPEPGPISSNSSGGTETKTMTLRAFDAKQVSATIEIEAKASLRAILGEIQDLYNLVQIFGCVTGVFPAKDCIRHGTPEQRLFSLLAMGDRFLQSLAGLGFPQRKDLVKVIARYLSDVSEGFTFLAMENELFSPQYHERIEGSSSSGRIIREMRGFLVVRKNSEQVVRLGRVLT